MHLLYANEWMTHAIMQAIGWTLVHSLWQGLIVSLLALCLLWSTKKSSPALRYNFLLLLLIIFLIAVLVTFSFYHKSRAIQQVREHVSLVNTSAPHFPKATVTHLMVEETKRHWTRFKHTFNMHANSIVAIWFLIFCIQGIRFGISLGYIYRIRHYKIYPPSTQWRARCNELKKILNIQKEVGLLESALVKVPVVIGYFKPLILIPIGLLSNLPYNQVESILLHELAHIKRRDYLINMLQSLVECLFFFNPALLWLSSLIKEEREACCDAQAVKQLGTKVQYIEALVSFQELSVRPSACALAFPGRRNFLLHRVQRILNNENTKLNSMEKTFLILGFSTIIAVSLIASKKVQAQKEILVPIIQSSSMLLDTVPKIKEQGNREVRQKGRTSTRVTTENDGHEKTVIVENKKEPGRVLSAKVINDTLREVSINGQAVPKAQMASYEVEIKSILTEQS
ncbi:MAG TPA: M56 family metallopeptidase, partial [Chitinophagaceae bacterium]|nr:M56 family metallopeptidase [Chitinophagaceae bacterium]